MSGAKVGKGERQDRMRARRQPQDPRESFNSLADAICLAAVADLRDQLQLSLGSANAIERRGGNMSKLIEP